MHAARALVALACLLGWLAAEARDKPVACKDARGHVTIQLPPCPEVEAPRPPPARPSCAITHAAIDRAARREELFRTRFPDVAAHEAARLRDVGAVVSNVHRVVGRLQDLKVERRKLDDEAEFHRGRPLPATLQAAIDRSDARFAALALTLRDLEHEIGRLQQRYRCERATFGRVWSGAPAGSSGCSSGCDPS